MPSNGLGDGCGLEILDTDHRIGKTHRGDATRTGGQSQRVLHPQGSVVDKDVRPGCKARGSCFWDWMSAERCSSSYLYDRYIAIDNMCLFVHAVVCGCGCVGNTCHMKQRSRADRLRPVRTLAVPHRSRVEALSSQQRSGAFTVCFPIWNVMVSFALVATVPIPGQCSAHVYQILALPQEHLSIPLRLVSTNCFHGEPSVTGLVLGRRVEGLPRELDVIFRHLGHMASHHEVRTSCSEIACTVAPAFLEGHCHTSVPQHVPAECSGLPTPPRNRGSSFPHP